MMTLTVDLSEAGGSWYPVLESAAGRQHEMTAGILRGVLERWHEDEASTPWVELAPDSPGESSYSVPAVMWAGETWPLITMRTDVGVDAELVGVTHSREHLQRWRERNEGITQQWLENHGEDWNPTSTAYVNAESVIDGVIELLTHPDLAAIAATGAVGVLTVDLDEESLVLGHPELTVISFTSANPHDHEGLALTTSTPELTPEATKPNVFMPGGSTPPPPANFSDPQSPEQDWGPPPPPPGDEYWKANASERSTALGQALREGTLSSTSLARASFNRVMNRLSRANVRQIHATTHPEPTPSASTPKLT